MSFNGIINSQSTTDVWKLKSSACTGNGKFEYTGKMELVVYQCIIVSDGRCFHTFSVKTLWACVVGEIVLCLSVCLWRACMAVSGFRVVGQSKAAGCETCQASGISCKHNMPALNVSPRGSSDCIAVWATQAVRGWKFFFEFLLRLNASALIDAAYWHRILMMRLLLSVTVCLFPYAFNVMIIC